MTLKDLFKAICFYNFSASTVYFLKKLGIRVKLKFFTESNFNTYGKKEQFLNLWLLHAREIFSLWKIENSGFF